MLEIKAIKKNTDAIVLALAGQSQEVLDCTTLDWQPENKLSCRLQNGALAQFTGMAHKDVMQSLIKKQGYLGLVVGELFYPLQRVGAVVASAKAVAAAPKTAAVKAKENGKTKKPVVKVKIKSKTPVKSKASGKKSKFATGKVSSKTLKNKPKSKK